MLGGLSGLNRVLGELRRRHVLRLAGLYVVGCWLILQASDVVLDIIGAPEGTLRMVAILLVLGFPLAVLIAWIYDLTPKGVVRTDGEEPGTEGPARLTWPWIGFVALVGALALLAYGVAQRERSGSVPPALSIAVLPFSDLSPEGDNRYFSDGLSEALMDSLSRVPDLQVAARTSSFAFRDPERDVRDVARELEVRHVLEGSVRKSGSQLRISARLVDGENGRSLWNASFDAQLADVFAVQDSISRGIAEALQIRLLGSEILIPVASLDPDAYEEYLRGRAELRGQGMLDNADRAMEHFRNALERESTFTPALAGLCTAYWEKYAMTRDSVLAEQAIEVCRNAEQADDLRPEVHVALAGLYRGTGQTERAHELLLRALEVTPNDADVNAAMAETLRELGELELARIHLLRAIELDPAYWRYHLHLARVLVNQNRLEEAIARANRAIRLQPDSPAAYNLLGGIYFLQGEHLKAADAFRQSISRHPNPVGYSNAGTHYFYAGDFAQAEEMFRQAVALSPQDFRYQGFLAETIELQQVPGREDARLHYEEAIRLGYGVLAINPEHHETRSAVASYLAQLGRRGEALRELEALQDVQRADMVVRRNIAMAWLMLGEHDAAMRYFTTAIAEGYPVPLLVRDPRLQVLSDREDFLALLDGELTVTSR